MDGVLKYRVDDTLSPSVRMILGWHMFGVTSGVSRSPIVPAMAMTLFASRFIEGSSAFVA